MKQNQNQGKTMGKNMYELVEEMKEEVREFLYNVNKMVSEMPAKQETPELDAMFQCASNFMDALDEYNE